MVLETPELEHLDEDAFDVVARYADLSEWNHDRKLIRDEGGKINMCKALSEWIAEERAEGKAEGKAESIVSLLEDIDSVPGQLISRISAESNLEVLNAWLKLAAKAESIQEFERLMQECVC